MKLRNEVVKRLLLKSESRKTDFYYTDLLHYSANLIHSTSEITCYSWKSKTMENLAFLLFSKYPPCFSIKDDIFVHYLAEIFKKQKCKNSV